MPVSSRALFPSDVSGAVFLCSERGVPIPCEAPSRTNPNRRREIALRPNLTDNPYSAIDFHRTDFRTFILDLLRIEREELGKLRVDGIIHDEVFHALSQEIDIEELRLFSSVRANIIMSTSILADKSAIRNERLQENLSASNFSK